MVNKKLVAVSIVIISIIINNSFLCFSVEAVEGTDEDKLKYYNNLNYAVGQILEEYNCDNEINYIDVACTYKKDDKLSTFKKISEVYDKVSLEEKEMLKNYLTTYGTCTTDDDLNSEYLRVLSIVSSFDNDSANITLYTNGANKTYSPTKAISYARKYYTNYNTAYKSFKKDCCNFVSQCLKAGGLNTNSKWYYNNASDYSKSWVNCVDLREYLEGSANANYSYWCSTLKNHFSSLTNYMKIRTGDVIMLCQHVGLWDLPYHVVLITSITSKDILYAGHTNDGYNKSLFTNVSEDDVLIFFDISSSNYK